MNTTLPQMLPKDINAELLLSYYPEGHCKVSFSGLHKRNTYNDIVDMERLYDDTIHVTLSRNSLYNSLPEYMFHPIDRFDNVPGKDEKEHFNEQLAEQTEEIANAYKFFSPIDILLFRLRSQVRERIETYAKEDVMMQQILGDQITPEQRANRFISQMIPFLPQCRRLRGNKTLLTLMLRKIFLEEGLHIRLAQNNQMRTDEQPRYADSVGMELGEGFAGNIYPETVMTYIINHWSEPESETRETFFHFLEEIEELRQFIQDYFLSVETELHFDIFKDGSSVMLSSPDSLLNYNTSL